MIHFNFIIAVATPSSHRFLRLFGIAIFYQSISHFYVMNNGSFFHVHAGYPAAAVLLNTCYYNFNRLFIKVDGKIWPCHRIEFVCIATKFILKGVCKANTQQASKCLCMPEKIYDLCNVVQCGTCKIILISAYHNCYRIP